MSKNKGEILTPFLDDADVIVYAGDCIDVMRRMPEASVDAIITDPPYGLEFMGKDWDGFGTPLGFQTWTEAWACEAFRVLKPGGHLLAFAGTRTYHRMASGVEDAGFEIRDTIAWMYGSGFPKSLDVSKAIDKAAGAEREIVGKYESPEGTTGVRSRGHNRNTFNGDNYTSKKEGNGLPKITAPATPEAAKWEGWGTALKPAFEPIVVARKPLTGTVAENVLTHGTGALNINATRIGTDGGTRGATQGTNQKNVFTAGLNGEYGKPIEGLGRWPANVTLDDTAANILDQQSGELTSGAHNPYTSSSNQGYNGGWGPLRDYESDASTGGASRFFYTAKASRQDRNTSGANNTHPTVKPTELMRWLIRLVTPPGGIILDPFGGSGSTGVAARHENTRCILIERDPEYLTIIRDRLAQQTLFGDHLKHE